MKKILPIILLFTVSIILAFAIQNMEDAKSKPANELIYFPSGRYVDKLALEYRTMAADLLWLQTIQYYGQHRLTDNEFKHLFKLFDVITMLDPNFEQCYVFGGTIVTYDQRSPNLGMELLKKGMINMPDSWRVPFIRGFLYYVYLRDYDAAFVWFRYASAKPDAPSYCQKFAAASKEKGGDYQTALRMWSQIYRDSENKYERERAESNIIAIVSRVFNKVMDDMPGDKAIKVINNELSKYDFFPFAIDASISGDSVIVERSQ